MRHVSINELTQVVIGAAIEVHRELGPGLLESAYESALHHELTLRGIGHERQRALAMNYKGVAIEVGYRLDLVVEGQVVLELKAVEKAQPLYATQLLTYLRLGGYPLGLLINFNVVRLVDGIERVSNGASNLAPDADFPPRTPRTPR